MTIDSKIPCQCPDVDILNLKFVSHHSHPRESHCRCWRNQYEPRKDYIKQQWLWNRFTSGWPCGGPHAPLEKVKNCLQQTTSLRKPFRLFTMLRDPIARTISEFHTTTVGWPQRDRRFNVKSDKFCTNNSIVPFPKTCKYDWFLSIFKKTSIETF